MRRKETSIQRTRHRRKRQDMPKQGTVCGLLAAAGPGVPGTLLTNHADGEPSVLGHDPGLEGQITAIGTLRLGVCEQQVHEALPRQGELKRYVVGVRHAASLPLLTSTCTPGRLWPVTGGSAQRSYE